MSQSMSGSIHTHGFIDMSLSYGTPSLSSTYWNMMGVICQPFLGLSSVGFFMPFGGAAVSAINVGWTALGSVSTPALTNTNMLSQYRRTTLTSSAASNSSAGAYSGTAFCAASNSQMKGGFVVGYRFSHSTVYASAGNRSFVGVSNVANPVASSDMGNSGYYYGFGYDSTDTPSNGWYFMCNNNGTRTKTQVSAMSRSSGVILEVWIWSFTGLGKISAWVYDVSNDTEVYPETTVSSNVPLDVMMYSTLCLNTGSSSSAVVTNIIKWVTSTPW